MPKGPVIGPMVIACAVFDNRGKQKLQKLGVKDSKKISPNKRSELEEEIKNTALEWDLVKLSPSQIDHLRRKISLNLIEAVYASELILSLESKPQKIIVDSPDSIEAKFKGKIEGYLLAHMQDKPQMVWKDRVEKIPRIISEHKADDRYVEVGAASILAKVERDREIEKLKEKHGECGSGYPSDEVTQNFLEKILSQEDLPSYVRKSWVTVTRERDKEKQSSLEEY